MRTSRQGCKEQSINKASIASIAVLAEHTTNVLESDSVVRGENGFEKFAN